MIRPAKCHFDGFIKAFIKGADKNHNPRKGTETALLRPYIRHNRRCRDKNHNPRKGTETTEEVEDWMKPERIRTIIPARGRKRSISGRRGGITPLKDKNHNPRKGTETKGGISSIISPIR